MNARVAIIGLICSLPLLAASTTRAQGLGDLGGEIDIGAEGEGDAEGGGGAEVDAEIDAEVDAEVGADAEAGAGEDQPSDPTARAREEFAAGVACVEQHETRCAADHFRAALELRDAPAVRYNLASALFELGHYPETARLVSSVLADPESPEDIRGHAQALQEQLRERAGTLTIAVSGSTDGAEVRIDDEVIPPEQQLEVPVAPGTRVVTVVRGGQQVARQEVEVQTGAQEMVELTVAPSPEELAAEAALAAEADEPADDGSTEFYEEWPFWAIVGGGVAAVAIVVIAIVVANENASVEDPVVGNYDPGVLRW